MEEYIEKTVTLSKAEYDRMESYGPWGILGGKRNLKEFE